MHYKFELNTDNPLGSSGEVLSALAELWYSMWNKSTNYSYVNPSQFKKVFCNHSPMYMGYQQHDSAEFLAQLLDYMHEDVNRVKEKKYVEMPDLQGTDEQQATTFWELHLQRNQSFIVDLMQGQYKSTVQCAECKHKKATFDAFTTVQLPIPY